MGLDRRKVEKLNLEDRLEWENKTITSAIKTYLRQLPEPLMSFRYHTAFIAAASKLRGLHTFEPILTTCNAVLQNKSRDFIEQPTSML